MALGESAKRSTTDIIEELRANAEHRFTPPDMGPEAPLGDIIIHGAGSEAANRRYGSEAHEPDMGDIFVGDTVSSARNSGLHTRREASQHGRHDIAVFSGFPQTCRTSDVTD